MLISVVTPVFNAAPYVRKAVETALEQPETAEVLLIEDGSPDDSFRVCEELDAEYEKVRLFVHPGNANLGAGPSRNVGIENARFDHIAFLDADDYYLPNRFRAERTVFAEHPDADGVYGALGFHFYSESGRKSFRNPGYSQLTTVPERVSPDALFESLMGLGRYFGGLTLNTLTLSKRSAKLAGGFPNLQLHEDSHFILRLALSARLYPGSIDEPVGMRGVHDFNRIVRNSSRSDSHVLMYRSLLEWAEANDVAQERVEMIKAKLDLARLRRAPYILRPAMVARSGIKSPSYFRWRNYRGEAFRALIPDMVFTIKRSLTKRK